MPRLEFTLSKFACCRPATLLKRYGILQRNFECSFLFDPPELILFYLNQYPGKKGEDIENHYEVPACVSVIIWLGLEGDQSNWTDNTQQEGEYSVYAETYENQMKVPLGGWTPKVIKRPNFSDSEGNIRLNKDAFIPPNGWKWDDPPDNEWDVDRGISSNFAADSGRKEFIQDAFENESRIPFGNWGKTDPHYTDIHGDEIEHRDETKLPDGWKWTDNWKVDNNRACDEEGTV